MAIRSEHIYGDKVGELIYVSPAENIGKKRQAAFLCRCGTEFITRIDRAKALRVKSCGCSTKEIRAESNTTHGLTKHPLYRVWRGMLQRCYNPGSDNYRWYGGRGVTVCDVWRESVEAFVSWAMTNGYQPGLELDKDMLGNGLIYSPSTCCFLTSGENNKLRRNNQFSLLNGEKMTDTEASIELGHDANYVSKIRCGAARNRYPNLVLLDRELLAVPDLLL